MTPKASLFRSCDLGLRNGSMRRLDHPKELIWSSHQRCCWGTLDSKYIFYRTSICNGFSCGLLVQLPIPDTPAPVDRENSEHFPLWRVLQLGFTSFSFFPSSISPPAAYCSLTWNMQALEPSFQSSHSLCSCIPALLHLHPSSIQNLFPLFAYLVNY